MSTPYTLRFLKRANLSPSVAAVGGPSVAIDTSAGLFRTSTNLVPVSLTVAAGTNRALIFLIGNQNTLTVSSVAYTTGSGGAWSKIGSVITGVFDFEIWASIGPSTGAVTAQATMSGTITPDTDGVLYSMQNVDQTTPADGYNSAFPSVNTVSTTLSSGGMVLAQYAGGSAPGAITSGAEDYTDVNNAFWRAGHNSSTGTVAWTNNGDILQICNVRKA